MSVCRLCHGTGVFERGANEPVGCPRHCMSEKAKAEFDAWAEEAAARFDSESREEG